MLLSVEVLLCGQLLTCSLADLEMVTSGCQSNRTLSFLIHPEILNLVVFVISDFLQPYPSFSSCEEAL